MATVHGQNARVYIRTAMAVLGLAVAMTVGTGCGNACQSLAKEICRCGRTQNDQNACVQRVTADTSQHPTKAQEELCQHLLDECTCDKLGTGDLAACGLAIQQ